MRRALNLLFAAGGHDGLRFGWRGLWRRLAHGAGSVVCLLVAGVSLTIGTSVTFAAEDAPLDFQVKAAFLVNFPKYVDWPSAVVAETNSPITVAILRGRQCGRRV